MTMKRKTDMTARQDTKERLAHADSSASLTRFDELKSLGFISNKCGYSSGKYALLFRQIEDITDEDWKDFVSAVRLERERGLRHLPNTETTT